MKQMKDGLVSLAHFHNEVYLIMSVISISSGHAEVYVNNNCIEIYIDIIICFI